MASTPAASLAILKDSTSLSQSSLPMSSLQDGTLLFLAPNSQGGLILQKRFYADFVGPGAAIGGQIDKDCTAIYAIGVVNFRIPTQPTERQQSLQTRMMYAKRLAEITGMDDPVQRTRQIMTQLQDSIGTNPIQKFPVEQIAHLAGISPKRLQTVEHGQSASAKRNDAVHARTLTA